ncbi:MAG: hypothetical protein CVT67_01385 [Actinobacteria bacterium HGW-Actinobacteria-7]|nr:MAG: hypothetical protein CVT67_01385 [Actinobacteria bacterium HGW-Actinobacteria-7]
METPEPNHPDELGYKASFWDSRTVNARLRECFPAPAHTHAAVYLADLAPAPDCGEEADETACRLMLAALKVSDGNLAKLEMWVGVARMEPRDLIAAAEYRRELELGTPEAREADLAEYLHWAKGSP